MTVCDAGSLSTAAHILGYSQSAVSRQVATLEREVGARLLERLPRGVRPTAAGQALLPHARLVVGELGRARESVRRSAEGVLGVVTLGAVPSATTDLVPRALRQFRERHAGQRCLLRSGVSRDLVERVLTGDLDLAVVTDYPPGLPTTRELREDDPRARRDGGDRSRHAPVGRTAQTSAARRSRRRGIGPRTTPARSGSWCRRPAAPASSHGSSWRRATCWARSAWSPRASPSLSSRGCSPESAGQRPPAQAGRPTGASRLRRPTSRSRRPGHRRPGARVDRSRADGMNARQATSSRSSPRGAGRVGEIRRAGRVGGTARLADARDGREELAGRDRVELDRIGGSDRHRWRGSAHQGDLAEALPGPIVRTTVVSSSTSTVPDAMT